jgi:hypothetical protein
LPDSPSEHQLFLAGLPPSQGQNHLAFGIVVILIIAFAITVPFANIELQRVDAFIPILETTILINDLISASLLFA